MKIDLNCDMGESFGNYTLGCDRQIIEYITSANLACGFHAADPMVMDAAIRLTMDNNVGLGAHPGYPDLRGFGRRAMDCPPGEVRADVLYQVGALAGLAAAAGARLQHVKPHGGLYNTAAGHEPTARGICRAIKEYDPSLILVCLAGPGGEVIRKAAADHGLKVAQEAFADRAYTDEGRLVPRGTEGAVITDPGQVAERCRAMASDGVVESINGVEVPLRPHTICVHGDTPTAVELAARIRETLEKAGVELAAMGSFVQ